MNNNHFLVCLAVFSVASLMCLVVGQGDYEFPPVKVEVLHPKGFRISIPDSDVIRLISIRGNINSELGERDDGDFSTEVQDPSQGRWTFVDRNTRFSVGDKIYFRLTIRVDSNGETIEVPKDLEYTVNSIPKNNGNGNNKNKGNNGKGNGNRDKNTSGTSSEEASEVCGKTVTTVNGTTSCRGKKIFYDTFTSLPQYKWERQTRFAGGPDYEFVLYGTDDDNLRKSQSKLILRPTLLQEKYGEAFLTSPAGLDLGDACTGKKGTSECVQIPRAWIILPPVISAELNTKSYFSFKYGTVEIKAKLPKGDWIYPKLYLTPKHDVYGDGLDSGRIVIAFVPGNADKNRQLSAGCVLGTSEVARRYAMEAIDGEKNWGDGFHTYKLVWNPDSIVVSVDNKVYGRIKAPDGGFASQKFINPKAAENWKRGTSFAPFDQEMYLSVGVGVGGQCFPDVHDGTKPWNNTDPKNQLMFYRAKNSWYSSWNPTDTAMIVESIVVTAL